MPVRGGFVYEGEWVDAQGQRRRKHLAGAKADAERILTKILRDRDLELAGMSAEGGHAMPMEEVVAVYLGELAKNGPRAVKGARVLLDRIIPNLPAQVVRDVTPHAVSKWRNARIEAGMARKTANNYVVALKAALNFCVESRLLGVSPIASLALLPVGAADRVRTPRALSEHEIARLLGEASKADAARPEHFPREPMIRAFILTGARYGELAQATWADLDEDRRCILLRAETTKSKKERAIPIHRAFVEELLSLKAHARRVTGRTPHEGSPIFLSPQGKPCSRDASNFRRHLHGLFNAAGIPHTDHRGRVVNVQALRTTTGTRWARCADIRHTQALLGHSTPVLTAQCYTDLDVEDLRDAADRLPPLAGQPLTGRAAAP